MTISLPAPEAKSADAGVATAFGDFLTAFEAFKETNDERLAAIERGRAADVLVEEKLARIDAAVAAGERRLGELLTAQRRPALDGAGHGRAAGTVALSPAAVEHKAAFATYVRTGSERALRQLEAKALSAGVDADGGYLVPDETEREILRRLAEASPIRAIAGNRQVSSTVYRKPFSVTGPAVGWVAETAARPQTDTPVLAELAFPVMELYAMPAATATLLDDAVVDVDRWIAEEVEQAFAEQEGAAFVGGDGNGKPKGFLAYTTVAESAWEWGKVGYVATGAAGAFAASNPSDVLVDLVYAVKAGYRQNGTFVMNRRTQAAVRKMKDGEGRYLWSPPAAAGSRASLMNFPVVEAEDMPDIGANAFALAFGDFRRFYLVVDRLGVRVLRDPYSAKPYVLFYTTKRVGGGIQDFDAVKLLKFAAS